MLAHGVVVQQVMVGKAQLQEHEEAAPIVRGPRGMMLALADFLLFRFCACVRACVWCHAQVCAPMHMCTEAREGCQAPYSIFYITLLRQGLLLILELSWQSANSSHLPVPSPAPQHYGYRYLWQHLVLPVLLAAGDPSSGPRVCAVKALTH